jgi:ketosteroid isomerase-like protein
MTPDDFPRQYEQVLGTHQWSQVAPLIHERACVTFSTGQVHKGKPAVQQAFEANFASIQDEHYEMLNVHWIVQNADMAVYLFDFRWTGQVGDREAHGGGRGKSVIVREGESWQLLAEHLGPAA